MTRWVYRLVREEDGQDLIEYSFLAIFVALALIVGMQALSNGLNAQFTNLGSQLGGS